MNAAANVHDSAPTASGNGWSVSAKNENLVGPSVTITPTAICVDRPAGYEVIVGPATDLRHQELGDAEAKPRCAIPADGGRIQRSNGSPIRKHTGIDAQPSWHGAFKSEYAVVPSRFGVN